MMHTDRYTILSLCDAHGSLRASYHFVMHTNRYALRAPAILRSFVIRPIGLLTHDLAGPKFMLIHVNMNRMTLVPWCITSSQGLRNLTGRYRSPEPSWSE